MKEEMKWFFVSTFEEKDYPCCGETVKWIIAAQNETEALYLLPKREPYEDSYSIHEFSLPDLKRKRKPFIYA